MDNAVKQLKKLRAKRVFVQFPEGIRHKMADIAKQLEKEGFEAVICTEPCYGACDIRDEEADRLKCDALLHIGHEDYGVKSKLPVVYWEYFIDVNPLPALEKEFDKLKNYKKIGLITSLQFVKAIPIVKEYLEKKGKKVFVHKALQYDGQILGCRLDAGKTIENKVDCFLCISAGEFYGLGMVLQTDKPMLNLDLEKKTIESLEGKKKKIQKIIAWNKSALKDAKRVGVLVSWKLGQLKSPYEIKKKLENEGKEVFILAMDEIIPEKVEGLKLDALVNCSCPRIGIDDLERYKIPVVNFTELVIKE
jgi:2-(3-amino-3-carboxypropyl)histidine synthase